MKAQREDIRNLLIAAPAITAIVGEGAAARVYQGRAALDAQMPYILVRLAGVQRPRTHDMRDSLSTRKADRNTWEIISVSLDGDQASTLAELVDDALEGKHIGETTVLLFEDASDSTDYQQDQSGRVVYQVNTQFITLNRAR